MRAQRLSRAPDALQWRYVKGFEALPDWERSMILAALERVSALLDTDRMDASRVPDPRELRRS